MNKTDTIKFRPHHFSFDYPYYVNLSSVKRDSWIQLFNNWSFIIAICLLFTPFALTVTHPCAFWSLLSPSPSRSNMPSGHSFRPHPHAAICLLFTIFALTLTQPCVFWSLLSPSPSRSLAPSRHSFSPHPHAAICLLFTLFALTLTQPCAFWSHFSNNWKLE
jgi:hypothetical protein